MIFSPFLASCLSSPCIFNAFLLCGERNEKAQNQHSIFKILHSLTHFSKFVSSFFSLRRPLGMQSGLTTSKTKQTAILLSWTTLNFKWRCLEKSLI